MTKTMLPTVKQMIDQLKGYLNEDCFDYEDKQFFCEELIKMYQYLEKKEVFNDKTGTY